MAQKKNPKATEAVALYRQDVPLVEIARRLNVPGGTVRRWKSTQGWGKESDKPNVRIQQSERSLSTPGRRATSRATTTRRADRVGAHRIAFEKNRKKIIASQSICAICGQPVDKTIRAPHPLSASVDHIVPVSRGGHPSDIANLQLTHRVCNEKKSSKLQMAPGPHQEETISNRELPQSHDWTTF